MKPQIKAIYIAVQDMDRAVKFYEEVFNIKVSSKDKRMSSFDFDNITLLLYNPKIDNEKTFYGNNTIPCIEVKDINKILELIKSKNLKIIQPLRKIENFKLFQAKDTEGNIIEFYQVVE